MLVTISFSPTCTDPDDQAAALSVVLHSLANRAYVAGTGALADHRLPPVAADVSVRIDERPAAPRLSAGGGLF